MKPQKYHLVGFAAIAAIFFFFLYGDTRVVSQTEDQLDRLVSEMPTGRRVVATIWPLPDTNVTTISVIGRVCIDRCFAYDDYEPVTGQFRTRAKSGNPFVMTDKQGTSGGYIARPRDLSLFEIKECVPGASALCVHEAAAGDVILTDRPSYGKPWVGKLQLRGMVRRFALRAAHLRRLVAYDSPQVTPPEKPSIRGRSPQFAAHAAWFVPVSRFGTLWARLFATCICQAWWSVLVGR